MTEERWLRDALRRATTAQPPIGEARADGALRLATVRKRQRLAMASVTAALAVFMASSLTGGGTRGLEPVSPTESPNASETPFPEESPAEAADPAEEQPEETAEPEYYDDDPGEPIPHEDRIRPRPGPMAIDVYFLFDSTGSMQPSLVGGVAPDIVRGLRARGHDVHYGYGVYRDKDTTTMVQAGQVYRRLAPIQADPEPFEQNAHGGGDTPDAMTMGLMGAFGWTDGLWVRESEPAGFRAGAHRFIVMVTNSPVHSGGDYPTIAEAITTMNEHSVWGVPIQVLGNTDYDAVRSDLDRIAAGTHAFAARTVDCDGDGRIHKGIDVRRGEPLVCTSYAREDADWSGLADAMIDLAAGGGKRRSP